MASQTTRCLAAAVKRTAAKLTGNRRPAHSAGMQRRGAMLVGTTAAAAIALGGIGTLQVLAGQSDQLSVAGLAVERRPVPAGPTGWAAGDDLRELEVGLGPGASLRAALEAGERGDAEAASALLRRVAERHPLVADYAGWLEARTWLEAERPSAAVEAAERAIRSTPDSPILAALYRILGDARFALDREGPARAAWETALGLSREADERAALHLAIGGSHERDGQPEAAAREYRTLWTSLPTSAEAEEAERRLTALEEALEKPLRTAADALARAEQLYRENRNGAALEACEAALKGGLDAEKARAAHRLRAHILFRMRRYAEAERAFHALGAHEDARLWRARSLARSGRITRSIELFEALAADSSALERDRARLLAALLLDDEEETERARAHYAMLAEQRRYPGYAAAALWRLGFGAYREGRHGEARARFVELARRLDDPLDRLRPRYWAARALESEDSEAAREELAALARAYPFSYYGWRSAQRLELLGHEPGKAEPPPPNPIPRGRDLLSEADLARPRILLSAGLVDFARRELDRLARRARGLDDRLRLARLNADAGDLHGAQRLIVDAYAEALARGPVAGLEELWWLAWPDAYGDLVVGALPEEAAIEPALVYAVMREESGYRPEVVSAAGAHGLLQIMPETGARLAAQLGLAGLEVEDLFEPEINLRLGGFYLERLTRRFDGNLSAAVAGYNAGPQAVSRWIDAALSDDVWVESIPYEQTRGYVRRVLRSLHVYRTLY